MVRGLRKSFKEVIYYDFYQSCWWELGESEWWWASQWCCQSRDWPGPDLSSPPVSDCCPPRDPREDDLKSELVDIVSHLMVVGEKRKHLAVIITLKTELEERLTRKSNNTFFNRSMDYKFIHHNDDIYKCRQYKFREVSRLVLFLTLSPLSFSPSVWSEHTRSLSMPVVLTLLWVLIMTSCWCRCWRWW